MKKKFLSMIYLLFSSLMVFAIDPSGSRVDFDDDYGSSNDGIMGLMLIGIIGFFIYCAYLYFSNKQSNPTPKPKKKGVEMYSAEWFDIQKKKAEKEDKETKWGCGCGLLFFAAMFFSALANTDTPLLEGIKDLALCFVPLIIIGWLLWLKNK